MGGLRSNFGGALIACMVVVLTTGVVAAWIWHRSTEEGDAAHRRLRQVLLVGAVLLVVAATALPAAWPPPRDGWGDVELGIGRGGLWAWRLNAHPLETLPAVQLWANVVVYIPVGAAALLVVGKATRALAVGVGLSLMVEAWQWAALSRVASTDDVLLNLTGAAVGVTAAAVFRHREAS